MDKVSQKLKNIKLLLLDFNGVIVPSNEKINVEQIDGYLSLLRNDILLAESIGIKLGVISLFQDKALIEKIKSAGIKDIIRCELDKLSHAEKYLKELGTKFEETGYIGDDLLDIPLLQKAGFSAAPETARREVKRIVDYICRKLNDVSAAANVLNLIKKVKLS